MKAKTNSKSEKDKRMKLIKRILKHSPEGKLQNQRVEYQLKE